MTVHRSRIRAVSLTQEPAGRRPVDARESAAKNFLQIPELPAARSFRRDTRSESIWRRLIPRSPKLRAVERSLQEFASSRAEVLTARVNWVNAFVRHYDQRHPAVREAFLRLDALSLRLEGHFRAVERALEQWRPLDPRAQSLERDPNRIANRLWDALVIEGIKLQQLRDYLARGGPTQQKTTPALDPHRRPQRLG